MGNCVNNTKLSEQQIQELHPDGSENKATNAQAVSGNERKLLYQVYESLKSRCNKEVNIGFYTFTNFCPIKGYWCDLIYKYID